MTLKESHHATRVLRLKHGDTILLLNGMGQKAEGQIIEMGSASVKVQVLNILDQTDRMAKLTIALANLKKTRQNRVVCRESC